MILEFILNRFSVVVNLANTNIDADSYCDLHHTTVLIIIISSFGTWRQTCILMKRGNKKIVSFVVGNCH